MDIENLMNSVIERFDEFSDDQKRKILDKFNRAKYALELVMSPQYGPSDIEEVEAISYDIDELENLKKEKTKDLLNRFGYEGDSKNKEEVDEFIEEFGEAEHRNWTLSYIPHYRIVTI